MWWPLWSLSEPVVAFVRIFGKWTYGGLCEAAKCVALACMLMYVAGGEPVRLWPMVVGKAYAEFLYVVLKFAEFLYLMPIPKRYFER